MGRSLGSNTSTSVAQSSKKVSGTINLKDGLPATVVTANTSAGGALVTSAYSYNKPRLLTGESV